MNDNNYVLLPQVKIGFIYNNIQTVVPFVLDESLDTYNLLRKLVDYCNELGNRSNELQYILKDLVDFLNNKLNEQKDYINNFLENLHQEWLDYKQSLEDKYNAFTEQVDELFETYKTQIRDEYNSELDNIRTNNETLYNNLKTLLDDKITELTNYANSIETNIDSYIDEKDQAIKELITNFQNEFTEYQKTVNNELIELGDTLTQLINTNEQNVIDEINTKTQEIVTSLDNVNMQQLVNNKLNSYNSEELSDLFTNLYGTLIRITYMNTDTPPTVVSETPIYHYNPTTNVLTDCTTGYEVPLLSESLYLYEGRLFVPEISLSFINDISVVTTNARVEAYLYNNIAVLSGDSSSLDTLIYNKDNGEVIYKDVIKTENGGINYIKCASLLNNILYFTGSEDMLYSLNLGTKEIKDIIDVGYHTNILATNNGVYIFNDNRIDFYNFQDQTLNRFNSEYGCETLTYIPFIDNNYYILMGANIYKTTDFTNFTLAYEKIGATPNYIFKNGDLFAVTNLNRLYNLDKKILINNTDMPFINSINTYNETTFKLNLFSNNNLINIKSFLFKNNITISDVDIILGNYIYVKRDGNTFDCYKFNNILKEIPYQRSDS